VKRLVLDTSVLIDYIILRSPYRLKVAKLLKGAPSRGVKLYVSVVTLSELLYVASRVYQAAGVKDPNGEALNFIEWIKGQAQIIGVDESIALRAGELKKQLRIALPDCYVIASAEAVGATPLFRRVEEEMRPVLPRLRSLGVKFLDEIEIEL
jgi:predicted nucleic acid-binding protein